MDFKTMRKDFMERYELSFETAYDSIYQSAVVHKGEKDYERRLISRVREQNYYLKGQLDLMALAGFLSFSAKQQEKERINTAFDAFRQFGIVLGTDGIVHKANLDNSLRIKDQEAWKRAEETIAIEKQVKAGAKTQKASAPVR